MNILDLLIEQSETPETLEFKLSKRIPNVKIRPITNTELADFRKMCMKTNKKGETTIDTMKFQAMVCSSCTLEPNFNNAEAIKKAKCTTGSELLLKVLKAGEIATLYDKINELSGYNDDPDEELNEFKKK